MKYPLSSSDQFIVCVMAGLSVSILIGIPFTLYLIG